MKQQIKNDICPKCKAPLFRLMNQDTTELRDMRGLAQFAHLRLLSVTDMEKLIARQNTCIAQLTTDHENAARYKEALEAIPMVLNMGASQQDVLNIVNNALKED